MKKILILFAVVAFFTSFLFFGCDALQNEPEDSESSETESLSVSIEPSASNVDKLYVGMSYEEAVSIMGGRHRSMASSLHPFVFEWDLDDGSILHMVFVIDDESYEDFQNEFNSSSTSESEEMHKLSEEQMLLIKELMVEAKCTTAYIKNGNEIIYIE